MSRTMSRRSFLAGAASSALLLGMGGLLNGCGFSAYSREVQDMYGRVVGVPDAVSRVFCTNPIGTVDLYCFDPDCLVGWNFRPSGVNRTFIPEKYLELPSLGVWMGAGSTPNAEEIAKQNPDALLCYWTCDQAGADMADDIAEETGLPVLLVDYDLRSTPKMYRYLGELMGQQQRGEELATYCENMLAVIERAVAAIPASERKSIFLAQGTDGLTTDPVGSMHVTDALELLGVGNVADMPGTEGQGMGMPSVNLEQIISWNPDAILVSEYNMSDTTSSDTYNEILSDARWKNVPCVAAGEVYRIPQSPFSWFGRPPSVVRLLGCLWILTVLYGWDGADICDQTRTFYQDFYGVEVDDATLAALLVPAGINPQTGHKA